MQRNLDEEHWDWPMMHKDGMVIILNTDKRFECDLEMPTPIHWEHHLIVCDHGYEFQVKVLNNELVLHCAQKVEDGHPPREVFRHYRLPSDVDLNSVKTNLNEAGDLLRVYAKKKT